MTNFRSVHDVAAWRLCSGCGACAYACPHGKVMLADVVSDGIRPVIDNCPSECNRECVRTCPGVSIERPSTLDGSMPALRKDCGNVLEVWEGYSTDKEVRYRGSSGGLASAVALYCIEQDGMHGVLHVGADPQKPWRNRTAYSRDRYSVLARTGSRYAPASPCDRLDMIEAAPRPSVFIGKPCDVAGLRKVGELNPALSQKTGVALSIFCAGTPSTRGTLDLLKSLKVRSDSIEELRYRGNGWPGQFSVRFKDRNNGQKGMSYKEAWSFLQSYRPLRCHLCPDGTGELADISFGDPWYRGAEEHRLGYSLAIVRTQKGKEILRGALGAGYIHLRSLPPSALKESQKNLLEKKGAIWGRLAALGVMLVPRPSFKGFSLLDSWVRMSTIHKARSIVGTLKRAFKRGYYKKQNCLSVCTAEPMAIKRPRNNAK